MTSLPKDVRTLLSEYIEETPEDWEAFKSVFDESGQITREKREKVLNRTVWIEIKMHLFCNFIKVHKIHTTEPDMETVLYDDQLNLQRGQTGGPYKTVFIEKKMRDLFENVIEDARIRYPLPSELEIR